MKATFQTSVDAVVLGKRLCQLKSGEEVSYADLESLVPGRNLRGKDRYILYSATKVALKESNMVVACVSGKGMKRLTNEEIADLPTSALSHVRRTLKRTSRKVLCSDYDKLNAEGKEKFNSSMSVMGAILQFTSQKSMNAIGERVKTAVNRLPVEETVGLFLKNSK